MHPAEQTRLVGRPGGGENRRDHVGLLLWKSDRLDPLLHRLRVAELGRLVPSRIIRTFDEHRVLHHAVESLEKAHHVAEGTVLALAARDPGDVFRTQALDDFESVARDLGPDVGLAPVDPRAAEFYLLAGERAGERAAAETISRFEQHAANSLVTELARRGHAGKSTTDDDDVVVHSPSG